MTKYLYEVFQTSRKNHCSDLTIALAMLLSDARVGKREYGPDGLDYQKLHEDYKQLADVQMELRSFIGRHYDELVQAYKTGERGQFEAVVERCKQQEQEQAETPVEE